jgi:MFS superfamily sulfate permease-like transporter
VDADAVTDIDYSAARTLRDLLGELANRNVQVAFARVSAFLRADLDKHGVGAMLGEARIFATLHGAIAALRVDRASTDDPEEAKTPAPG